MIAHTIQLALAPVFVLVAIGNLLNLLSMRMARVIDRYRLLQDRHAATQGAAHDQVVAELRVIDRRFRFTTHAIRLFVLSGLAIGLTVVTLFVDEMARVPLDRLAAVFFVISIGLLMAGLSYFLLETQTAGAAMRVSREYLETDRNP